MRVSLAPSPAARPPRLLALAAALLAWSCAAAGSDIHLAPFYTRLSSAGGGSESEALAGAWLTRRDEPGGEAVLRAVRPFWSWQKPQPPRYTAYTLPPLGWSTGGDEESRSLFFPLYFWSFRTRSDGVEQTDLVVFPGIVWSSRSTGLKRYGWFIFYGDLRYFLTFDRIHYVLFPVYLSTSREGHESRSVLWPVFRRGWGAGLDAWRVWPLAGHNKLEGYYDRRFFLWPFFHYSRENLEKSVGPTQTRFFFFPVFGKTRQKSYRSWTFLWPFFGYARDPRAGFWAIDLPWPLVRIQEGGKNPEAEDRFRIWPFYSYFRTESAVAQSVAWPFITWRREDYALAEGRGLNVIPFWHSWDRKETRSGIKQSYSKLWPLFERRRDDRRRRIAFPVLSPFQPRFVLDFHWGWLVELWSRETDVDWRKERSFGAIWRREDDALEERSSFSFLWSRRRYEAEEGRTTETSLLFGLLRWRSIEERGTSLLRPAFPGPGWPAERVTPPTYEGLARPFPRPAED